MTYHQQADWHEAKQATSKSQILNASEMIHRDSEGLTQELTARESYFDQLRSRIATTVEHNVRLKEDLTSNDTLIASLEDAINKMKEACQKPPTEMQEAAPLDTPEPTE